jgi:hypothetical protein
LVNFREGVNVKENRKRRDVLAAVRKEVTGAANFAVRSFVVFTSHHILF